MKTIPPNLRRAIEQMPTDRPDDVVAAIERAGYRLVPIYDLKELRRAWDAFLDSEGAFDRLARITLRLIGHAR